MTDDLDALAERNVDEFVRYRMKAVPADIEEQIQRVHDHEGPNNRALWLIWKIDKLGGRLGATPGSPDFPSLHSVADSIEEARYLVSSILGPASTPLPESLQRVWVERVPANHNFASSLNREQFEAHNALWKARSRRRDGD